MVTTYAFIKLIKAWFNKYKPKKSFNLNLCNYIVKTNRVEWCVY